MLKLLFFLLLALPLFAADIQSEIAKLDEAIDAAYRAHDTVVLAKLLTDGYQATSSQGTLRDLQGALAFAKSGPAIPADLKKEVIKTNIYGDTVLQLNKETYTTKDGAKRQIYVNLVFVKQSGVWKNASRAATIIPQ